MTDGQILYENGEEPYADYWDAYSLTKDEMVEILQDAQDDGEWLGWTDPKNAARGIIELCIGWGTWNDDDDESHPSFGGNDPFYEYYYFPKGMKDIEWADEDGTDGDIYEPMEALADKDPVELDGDNIIEWVKALPFNKLVLKCGYCLWFDIDSDDDDDDWFAHPYCFLSVR